MASYSLRSSSTNGTTAGDSIVRRARAHNRTAARSRRLYSFQLGSPQNPVRLDQQRGPFVAHPNTRRQAPRRNRAVNGAAEFQRNVVVIPSDEEEMENPATAGSLQRSDPPRANNQIGIQRRSSVRLRGNPKHGPGKRVFDQSAKGRTKLEAASDLAEEKQPDLVDSDSSTARDGAVKGAADGQTGADFAHENAAIAVTWPASDGDAAILPIGDEARVKDCLRIFNAHFLHFAKEEEDRCNRPENTYRRKGSKEPRLGEYGKRVARRPDLKAISKIIETKAVLYPKKQFGHLPGIKVGDHFFSRGEMVALGFHSHWLSGIDYMAKPYNKMDDKGYNFPLAVSIILSGIYEDDVDNSEEIIYTGQGGNNLLGDKRQVKDQEMLRGNLALKNNMDQGIPVRVVRGHHSKNSYSGKVYTYDGLYKVVRYWAEKGLSGFTVFKFSLKRLEGQTILTTNQVHSIRTQIPRCPSEIQGLLCEDISKGQENFPIPATNVVDDTLFPPLGYEYCRNIIIGKGVNLPTSGGGCKCKGECIDPNICSCAILNGTHFPYVRRDGGRLVEAKDVLFECGPTCNCGPDCVNRTSQQGLKYRLEVFRTASKGWGVRSWDFIPAGAPICEYFGILTRSDDLDIVSENNFIFEIDCLQTMKGIGGRQRRLGDVSRHDNAQIQNLVDKKVDAHPEFCIDSGTYGNVSRFINHSCEPNLFVQCVLSSHHDIRLARIVLFAADNIPPLQELSYDYGYTLDSVVGDDGKIKKMACYCGAVQCRKRLY